MRRAVLALVVCGLTAGGGWAAEVKAGKASPFARPKASSAKEPAAKTVSLAKGAEFLDAAAVDWTRTRNCGSCHTNIVYLLARPALKEKSEGEAIVRGFFEKRVANWDGKAKGEAPRWDAEVVVTAAALAFHDSATTGKLHPLTRQALDRMWRLQRADGAWAWLKCGWPPFEHDDYFGAAIAAVALGVAPDNYAATEKAQAGLAKLRGYFRKVPAPTLHHKVWLLWASARVEGLMTAAERDATVKALLALQKADGGWSLPSLGDWRGHDGRANDVNGPSDGYATGLAVYVLRQSGLRADHGALRKGVAWLKANQRESGRWFTRSLNSERSHYITHTGSAFAVLALKACE
jgi:squalene-hopene/tetraprenyl-beta-curcumene cyclase